MIDQQGAQKGAYQGLSPIGTQCEPMGLNAVYGEIRACGAPQVLIL